MGLVDGLLNDVIRGQILPTSHVSRQFAIWKVTGACGEPRDVQQPDGHYTCNRAEEGKSIVTPDPIFITDRLAVMAAIPQEVEKGWLQVRYAIARLDPISPLVLGDETHQLALGFVESDVAMHRYEYFVLVTNLPHEIQPLAQLYRDRADSENTFDELKNQ